MNTIESPICFTTPSNIDKEPIDPKIQKRNEYARNYYRKKYQENEDYRTLIREKTKKAYYKRKSELEMLKNLHKDYSLVTV